MDTKEYGGAEEVQANPSGDGDGDRGEVGGSGQLRERETMEMTEDVQDDDHTNGPVDGGDGNGVTDDDDDVVRGGQVGVIVGGAMPSLNPKGKNMEFKIYIANSRNNSGSLDGEDNVGAGDDYPKPDDDGDGRGSGGGMDPSDRSRDCEGAGGCLDPDLVDVAEEFMILICLFMPVQLIRPSF